MALRRVGPSGYHSVTTAHPGALEVVPAARASHRLLDEARINSGKHGAAVRDVGTAALHRCRPLPTLSTALRRFADPTGASTARPQAARVRLVGAWSMVALCSSTALRCRCGNFDVVPLGSGSQRPAGSSGGCGRDHGDGVGGAVVGAGSHRDRASRDHVSAGAEWLACRRGGWSGRG